MGGGSKGLPLPCDMKKTKSFVRVRTVFAVLILFFSIALLIYPIISNYTFEHRADSLISTYEQQAEDMEDSAVTRLWQEAMEYNQALLNNHVQLTDPFETVEQKMDAGVYSEMLSVEDSAIMTYIEIPKISVYLPVYHGTEPKTLEMGVGHLEGSSLPVGGDSTHCILSGHTGLNRAKIFTDLSELKAGDHFFLHTLGKTLAYEVDQILTVEPYDISNLQLEEGRDYVTLVTCTPYGVNSHRLLVRGTRTEYEPETIKLETELAKDNPSNQSQWMREYQKALATGIALVLLVSVLALTVERWRKHHANR